MSPEEKESRRRLHNVLSIASGALVLFGVANYYRRRVQQAQVMDN
jgi:hypothetical protein